MWKIILFELLSLDFLNEDSHPFVIVLQSPCPSIEECIGVEGGSINSSHGSRQIFEILIQCSLIWQEHTVILACEGSAKIIFQLTGRPNNHWLFFFLLQDSLKPIQNIRWKFPCLKIPHNCRILCPHFFFAFILLIIPVGEVIDGHEGVDFIGTNVMGLRWTHAGTELKLFCIGQDTMCQQHASCFSPDFTSTNFSLANLQ